MRLPEVFFAERTHHLLAWRDGPVPGGPGDGGPVLGEVRDDGALHITAPGRAPVRVELDVDALVFVEERATVAAFRLDGTRLSVLETRLDGTTYSWDTALAPPAEGPWSVLDVVPGTAEDGTGCTVLTTEDAAGTVLLQQVREGAPVRCHSPAGAGQLLHWDLSRDVLVLSADRGPWLPRLTVEHPLSGRPGSSRTARWYDAHDGVAALSDDDGGLFLWDLRSAAAPTPVVRPAGLVDDARFLRGLPGRLLVVVTAEGRDTAHVCDVRTGGHAPVDGTGGGRLRVRTAGPDGVGLYRFSTLGGSSWLWWDAARGLRAAAGEVPPYAGNGTVEHTRLGHVPALLYLPEGAPSAVVVSLHGGPESVERDELRWDGLYRELLDRGVAVIGLNYTGSAGYGRAHTRRAWPDWERAFADDLAACRAVAASWRLGPERIALLGGSFGGALALLGCVLDGRLAGAVASAPLIDVARHARRAAAADPAYRPWFDERFGPVPDGAAHPVFATGRLSGTAPGQRVVVVHGAEDEVTSCQDSLAAVESARSRGLPWTSVVEAAAGHVPASGAQAWERYTHVRDGLAEVLWGAPPRR